MGRTKSGSYNTKQSCEILNFLKENQGSHYTSQEISDHFRAQGINIGQATIYRRLDRLTTEGLMLRIYRYRSLQERQLLSHEVRDLRQADTFKL